MVQPIEASSSAAQVAALTQEPRALPPSEQPQAAGDGGGVTPATQAEFEKVFGLAVFYMIRQETDRLRIKTEQIFNEMREEE